MSQPQGTPPPPRRAPKPIPPPPQQKPKFTPTQYKSAERKVQAVIVALPIAIVTSWILYNRLYKGEERKQFQPPAEGGLLRKDE